MDLMAPREAQRLTTRKEGRNMSQPCDNTAIHRFTVARLPDDGGFFPSVRDVRDNVHRVISVSPLFVFV